MGRDNEGVDWIPSHVSRGLDEEKIVYSSVPVVSMAFLIRRYQFFHAVIKVYTMMERGVLMYGL